MGRQAPGEGEIVNSNYFKDMAQQHGCHWFDTTAMRFFNSRICETTWTKILVTDKESVYRFISSEKGDWTDARRWYTVREWRREPDPGSRTGVYVSVSTVGEFQQYATAKTALAHIHDGEVTD